MLCNLAESRGHWTVDFLALDDVVNPRVYNMVTGKYVKILKTMEDGERITISTEGEELCVLCIAPDGTPYDGFKYLDIESEPFKLAVGENYIKTDAENETTMSLRASISFQKAYAGV